MRFELISVFLCVRCASPLQVILYAVTPQVIEVWEGVATFLLFFVLVIMAYFMDVRHKICRPTKKTTSKVAPHKPNQTLSADNRGEKPAWHRQSIDGCVGVCLLGAAPRGPAVGNIDLTMPAP